MKVCLIGSTRFKEQYEKINKSLSLRGYVVYSVSCYGHSGDTLTDAEKQTLDLVHLKKILESDAVCLVTDDSGYYGESTKREIEWAIMNDKKFLEYGCNRINFKQFDR